MYIFTYSPSPLLPFLPPPSLLVTTSLLSVSVSLFLFCYKCPFTLVFKLHRQMKRYSACLSLSCFTEQSHLLSQTANFHYFLLLSNIFHHVCVCLCVFVWVYMYVYIYTHHMLFFANFYWNIFDLQCWVSFFCTPKWISYTFTYIHSFFYSFPI